MELPKIDYTKEKWENLGLLNNIPEDRKDNVVETLNFAVKLLLDNQIHLSNRITRESDDLTITGDDLIKLETVFIPLLLRTLVFVDISHEEIKYIYNDFIFDYTKAMRNFEKQENLLAIDFEAKYMCEYSDEIIKRLQK